MPSAAGYRECKFASIIRIYCAASVARCTGVPAVAAHWQVGPNSIRRRILGVVLSDTQACPSVKSHPTGQGFVLRYAYCESKGPQTIIDCQNLVVTVTLQLAMR